MTKLYIDEGVYDTSIPGTFPTKSTMVSLFDYHGKAQGSAIGLKVWEQAMEDRVEIGIKQIPNAKYPQVRTYPRTWLDKLDFIDQVHDTGAASDKEIIEKIVKEYEAK